MDALILCDYQDEIYSKRIDLDSKDFYVDYIIRVIKLGILKGLAEGKIGVDVKLFDSLDNKGYRKIARHFESSKFIVLIETQDQRSGGIVRFFVVWGVRPYSKIQYKVIDIPCKYIIKQRIRQRG